MQRRFAAGQVLDGTWPGDITYLRTWEGWAYLATVIDLGSRRVVGFAVAGHMRSSLVEEAMEMAVLSRRPAAGLIFHSDRGSQYTSSTFRNLLDRHSIHPSPHGRPLLVGDAQTPQLPGRLMRSTEPR